MSSFEPYMSHLVLVTGWIIVAVLAIIVIASSYRGSTVVLGVTGLTMGPLGCCCFFVLCCARAWWHGRKPRKESQLLRWPSAASPAPPGIVSIPNPASAPPLPASSMPDAVSPVTVHVAPGLGNPIAIVATYTNQEIEMRS